MNKLPARILVTGGAGFIGSTLVCQCLVQKNVTVLNLDKITYAGHRLSIAHLRSNKRHTLVEGDIANSILVKRLLSDFRPQAIVHMAAETHVDRSIEDPSVFATTNVLGSCVLLEQTTRYWRQLSGEESQNFRFLHVSTDEVYGSAGQEEVFDERSLLRPNSPYAASKSSAEHFVRAFIKTFDLPAMVVNPSNNYGPRQHPEKLIPKMIVAAVRGKPLTLYGDGMHQRNWLHVSDCCRALLSALIYGDRGDSFTLGGNRSMPNLQVVEMICDVVDSSLNDGKMRRSLITHVSDRLGHDRRYAISSERLMVATGWYPQISLEAGLRETVEWYLKHPDWVEQSK